MRRAILGQVNTSHGHSSSNFRAAAITSSALISIMPGSGCRAAGMGGRTDRVAQYDAASPERPIARRIRGSEDCDHGHTKS